MVLRKLSAKHIFVGIVKVVSEFLIGLVKPHSACLIGISCFDLERLWEVIRPKWGIQLQTANHAESHAYHDNCKDWMLHPKIKLTKTINLYKFIKLMICALIYLYYQLKCKILLIGLFTTADPRKIHFLQSISQSNTNDCSKK